MDSSVHQQETVVSDSVSTRTKKEPQDLETEVADLKGVVENLNRVVHDAIQEMRQVIEEKKRD